MHYNSSGANLYHPGILFADDVMSFSGVTFALFCFGVVFLLSLKPRLFVQSFFVLRYACAPTATRVSSYFSLEMSLFPSIFVTLPFSLLYGK